MNVTRRCTTLRMTEYIEGMARLTFSKNVQGMLAKASRNASSPEAWKLFPRRPEAL